MGEPVRDLADLYRVYTREWVTVFTAEGPDTGPVMAHFDTTFAGRVAEHDVRIIVAGSGPTSRTHLQLLLHNMKGEFKTVELALAFADGHFPDGYNVVARNSARDHELRNYGVKKLPA